jgi:succinoglycan biosynthesis protein ExoA
MTLPTQICPAVSIVIPCRNERDHIRAMIQSISDQDPPRDGFEVIIADGMSDDGTREIFERLAAADPRIRIIDNPERIVSTGLNAAVRAARGEVILRMDVHTRFAPDYIRQCLAALEQTGADNVGGPWVARGDTWKSSAIAAVFQSRFGTGGARGHDSNYGGPVDTVYLGCWHRSIFDRIGMFDEELVRNQDDEFNLRLTRAGGKIWQSPRIRSWYHPRPSLIALVWQYMQYGYWKVRVIQKHKIPASWRHLAPGSFVLALLVLSMAAPLSSLAAWAWTIVVGTYAVCNVAASFFSAARHGWKLLPVLPLVFACYHFSYGYGFLRGIVDFVVLRRKPAARFSQLTRSSPNSYRGTPVELRRQ